MSRVLAFLLALALLGVAAPIPQSLDGVAIGSNIRDVVKTMGNPDVVNTDVGHVWSWTKPSLKETLRVTTDDDGVVQMVDVSSPAQLDRPPYVLGPSLSTADGNLPDSGDAAEFRRYQGTPPTQIVLAYASNGGALREIFIGTAIAIANAGLVPGKASDDSEYRAPLLDTIGSADYNGNSRGVVYTRIAINKDGTIAKASVFISSGDGDLDRVALAIANGCTFEPATLRGRKAPSVYFRRENFLINS